MSTAIHEASHAAATVLCGRQVERVWRAAGFELPGDRVGLCRLIPAGEADASRQLMIAIIGYLAEREPDWPPPYELARHERRDALGIVIRHFGLDAEQYADAVRAAHEMLADPDFTRLRDAIGRALRQVPHLEREDVEALAAIHLPERQEQADEQAEAPQSRPRQVHRF